MPFRRVQDPKRLQAVIEAMLLIGTGLDLQAVLESIARAAVDLAGARYGALGVLNPAGEGLSKFITVGMDFETRRAIDSEPHGLGLLGLLVREPAPLRLADLTAHPASVGFPPGHPPMRSFLGVPVLVRGAAYGSLYLCDKIDGDAFSQDDEDTVSTFALAAGLVIDKSRLHDRIQVLTLAEDRERIARDLHDTVLQRLFAIGLGLQGVSRLAASQETKERLESAVAEIDETIHQIRTTIFAINRPHRSGGEGLRNEVFEIINQTAGSLGLDIHVSLDGPIDTIVGPSAAEHLLASLREAVTNVIRHSQATALRVSISARPGELVLRVADNGKGPGTERALEGGTGDRPRTSGQGLVNLRGRATLLGGSLTLERPPEGGTELVWRATLLA